MTTNVRDPLSGISEPSEKEKVKYFAGLGGRPRLVARTSTTAWQEDYDWGAKSKSLWTLGEAPIVKIWCEELRSGLVSILNRSGLQWDTFYPIRIGYDGEEHPVVLLVGALPTLDLAWRKAMQAALRCRLLLVSFGITDVEVEMLQSRFLSFGPPTNVTATAALMAEVDWTFSRPFPILCERDDELARINGRLMTLLPFSGRQIERDEPSSPQAGTVGIHIRLSKAASDGEEEDEERGGKRSSGVFALASRHVAVGQRVPDNEDIRPDRDNSGSMSLRVLTSGLSGVNDVLFQLKHFSLSMKNWIQKTEKKCIRYPDNIYLADRLKRQNAAVKYIAHLEATAFRIKEAKPENRILGSVTYAPRHQVGKHRYFQDWALVAINDDDHDTNSDANKLYMADRGMGQIMDESLARATVAGTPLEVLIPDLDDNGFLRLHTHDMPPHPPFHAGQDQPRRSQVVIKRGQKTGLTIGTTNEIEAVRRIPLEGTSVISLHLLVLGFRDNEFSSPGDSGAAVVDGNGCMVGLIDGGQQMSMSPGDPIVSPHAAPLQKDVLPERSTSLLDDVFYPVNDPPRPPASLLDVTFVTPFQWILDDIREFTGREPEVV